MWLMTTIKQQLQELPEKSIDIAFDALSDQLQKNYEKKDWESRARDFDLIKQHGGNLSKAFVKCDFV